MLDVALAVGNPITTIVMIMITPHRAIGTGPAKGMTIGIFRDATVVIATTMTVRDVIVATLTLADLEALEEGVVEIEEQGNS
jgi:hypothetical protein